MVKSHDLTQKKYTTHLSSLVTSVGDIIESIAALHAEVRDGLQQPNSPSNEYG